VLVCMGVRAHRGTTGTTAIRYGVVVLHSIFFYINIYYYISIYPLFYICSYIYIYIGKGIYRTVCVGVVLVGHGRPWVGTHMHYGHYGTHGPTGTTRTLSVLAYMTHNREVIPA